MSMEKLVIKTTLVQTILQGVWIPSSRFPPSIHTMSPWCARDHTSLVQAARPPCQYSCKLWLFATRLGWTSHRIPEDQEMLSRSFQEFSETLDKMNPTYQDPGYS